MLMGNKISGAARISQRLAGIALMISGLGACTPSFQGEYSDPNKAEIVAPAIEGFQEARRFAVGEAIPVAPGKGWLLEVRGR